MNYDKGYFDSPEFRGLLKKYEQALSLNATPYFGLDEFADLMSYYLFLENSEKAAEVLDISQRTHPGAPENIKMEIKMLLCNGEPEKALKKFSTLGYFNDEETMLLQAEILLALKDFKHAREIALAILQKASAEQDSIYDALEILLDCGFAMEALIICEKALKAAPHKKNLTEVKAECLIEMQRTDEAIDIYNTLLDEDPYSTIYWEQMGHIHYMVKKFGKALDCFEYESTINEGIEYSRMMQAYCYYFVGDYDSASEIFTSFEGMYPKSIIPFFYNALIKYHKREEREAIGLFKELIEKCPEGTIDIMLARINKAMLLDRNGETSRAEETLSMALLMHPDNMKQLMLDGTYLYELRDKENLTFEDMNTLETKEWTQAEELHRLGEHLVKHGHLTLALRVFRYCREFSYDKSETDAYIAYILWNTGKQEKCEPAIENALEGRSWTLFRLFGIPYRNNLSAKEFIRQINATE